MALTDHHDVFIGSTDNGHTFAVLNTRLTAAHRLLTEAGFTAREHPGRTVYLLPPGQASEDAHDRTSAALYGLLAHTMDFVDLSWTTRRHESGRLPEPDAHIRFSGSRVTATVRTQAARAVLEQHAFHPAGSGYALPHGMSEREKVGAVAQAETHLSVHGLGVKVSLGIATPSDIPPAPGRTPVPTPPPGIERVTPRRARP